MFIMKKYNNNALNPDSHTKYIKKISYGKIQYGYPKKKKKHGEKLQIGYSRFYNGTDLGTKNVLLLEKK